MCACSKSTIRTKCKICSQLTKKTLERHHRHHSSAFILNFEQFSRLIPWLQLPTLNSPFNFAINKICVAIRLIEDGTKIGGT